MDYLTVKKEINRLLINTFKLDDNVNSNLLKTKINEWDSLKHITIITALEEDFDVQFEPEEIDELTSTDRIAEIIIKKL